MHAAQRLLPAGLVWVDRCRHIAHCAVLLLVGFGFVAFSDLGLYRLPAALPGGIEFTIGAGDATTATGKFGVGLQAPAGGLQLSAKMLGDQLVIQRMQPQALLAEQGWFGVQ